MSEDKLNEPNEPNEPGIRNEPEEPEPVYAALAEAQAALTEKDERISGLEADLAEVKPTAERFPELQNAYDILKADFESSQQDRAALTEASTALAEKYLESQRALHPDVPAELIKGATLKEIEDSVASAVTIVDAVRANLATEARNNRVPAGAPTRRVNLEGLSPAEKIKLGLEQQKGGTE